MYNLALDGCGNFDAKNPFVLSLSRSLSLTHFRRAPILGSAPVCACACACVRNAETTKFVRARAFKI